MTRDEIDSETLQHLAELRAGVTAARARWLEGLIVTLTEPLIRFIASGFERRFRYQTSTIDDLYQAGRMGCVLAIRSFDPGKASKFGPHAYVRIHKQLQKHTLDDRIVRMASVERRRGAPKNYWAPAMVYAEREDTEHGDLRDDLFASACASEVRCVDLGSVTKTGLRRLRRRLRQRGLL